MPEAIISETTAYRILSAHRELAAAAKLKTDIAADLSRPRDRMTPPDHFGRSHVNYQFGVPSGRDGHRLFHVSALLADYVIDAHIADQKRQLAEACVVARMELDGLLPVAEPEPSA